MTLKATKKTAFMTGITLALIASMMFELGHLINPSDSLVAVAVITYIVGFMVSLFIWVSGGTEIDLDSFDSFLTSVSQEFIDQAIRGFYCLAGVGIVVGVVGVLRSIY